MQIGQAGNLDPVQALALERRLARELELELARQNGSKKEMHELKSLAAGIKDGIAAMEMGSSGLKARAKKLADRFAEVEGKLHSELDQAEAAIVDAEGALSPVSNGGPPLGNG